MRHVIEVADWVEASAAHFVGTLVGLTLVALLALIGSGCVARWVWLYTHEDTVWLLGWAGRRLNRRQWERSTQSAPSVPTDVPAKVRSEMATAAVRDTFGPVALLGRRELPRREPGDHMPDGLPATEAHQAIDDLIAWVQAHPDPNQPGEPS